MPDWITLSKFVPQLIYPFNLALLLIFAALLLIIFGRRRSGLCSGFLAVVILAVCSSPLSLALYREHELKYPPVPVSASPAADAIVVLGGDVGIPVPPRAESQMHGNRLLHGFRLFKAGKAPLILLTGGNVFAQEGLEAEVVYGKAILANWGIPEDAIMVETKSRNTHQNAIHSLETLKGQGIDKILLVTNAFHMPRAAAVFRHVGFDVIPSSSSLSVTDYRRPKLLDWWPSLSNLGKAQAVLREKLGLFVYRFRGWID